MAMAIVLVAFVTIADALADNVDVAAAPATDADGPLPVVDEALCASFDELVSVEKPES